MEAAKDDNEFFKKIEKKLGAEDFEKFAIAVISSNAIVMTDQMLDYLYELAQSQESSVDKAIIAYLNEKRGFEIK